MTAASGGASVHGRIVIMDGQGRVLRVLEPSEAIAQREAAETWRKQRSARDAIRAAVGKAKAARKGRAK